MIRNILKLFDSFAKRMQDDHMGAYAATCAYFLMISFVPICMVVFAIAQKTNADISALTAGMLGIIPSGLKEYIATILHEIQLKSYTFVPVSLLILIWSAAKVFHALSNGLNVINKVQESRGWFFLRVRSMLYIVLFLVIVMTSLLLSVSHSSITAWGQKALPSLSSALHFLYSFRSLFGYIGLIFVFLFIYKFLPNCYYTFRSQFPGALVVATIWMFTSYLLSLYYEHNRNFSDIYGSLTGIILAMIWLYFCCYFLYLGAELNRVIYEDPDQNIIVSTISIVRDASARKQRIIEDELNENSVWKPISGIEDLELPNRQPSDIEIHWSDEGYTEESRTPADAGDFYRSLRKQAAQRSSYEEKLAELPDAPEPQKEEVQQEADILFPWGEQKSV
ncbi:MAG: YihY/virulence factor BrkB family protein [Lachnospiraceae bacterium]|nr:YihY/virulence factor BrkB family protein [Lachnospiraceae bacterium]